MQKAVHASIDTSYAVLHHTISNTVCPQLLGAQNAYTLSVIDIQMRLLADLEISTGANILHTAPIT